MTTAEAAKYLGISKDAVLRAGDRKQIPFHKDAAGRRSYQQADLDMFSARDAARARKPRRPPTPEQDKRPPGMPTRARELSTIVLQMRDLATQAEQLADDMLPAQLEYAFRLVWDNLDDDHRALMAAFVDTQRAKARRGA